ncbi:MAG TPA: hypothetical protein VG757_06225 [Devosia sp.]|nr:hypothetical protein [Devosia sp.]
MVADAVTGTDGRRGFVEHVKPFPPVEAFFPRRKFDPDAPICFVHVMKTAGTTVRLTLENAFDGEQVFPSGSSAYVGGYLKLREALQAGDDFNSYAAISGHYGWKITAHLSARANLFTWFREPRDRAISHFFFKVVQNRAEGTGALLQRIDSGERLESIFMDWARKMFVQPFHALAVGNPDKGYGAAKGGPYRDVAIDVLHRCFFIGLLEDHERSLDGLSALTSILPPKQEVKRNVGVKRGKGLSLLADEQAEFDSLLATEIAFYERVRQVYDHQMKELREAQDENPAFGLIGNREGLRQYLLGLPQMARRRKLTQWKAWDAVQGENLDSREEFKEKDGKRSRWRWTASMPDTYLYFDPPPGPFRIRLRLNPATPLENARNAELRIAGHEIDLRLEAAPSGRNDLVGEISAGLRATFPETLEFHIHTPVMLDESKFGYRVGTRMLGLALESISAEPLPDPWIRRFGRLVVRMLSSLKPLP